MKKVKYLLQEKKSTVHVDRHMGGQTHRWAQRENCWVIPLWWPELLLWGISFIFSWPIILTCLVQSPYLVYIRILPCVCTYHLVKMDSTEDVYGYQLTLLPFWTPRSLSTRVVRKIFWLRMRNIWSLIFCLGRAQAPLSVVLLFLSWYIGPRGKMSHCFTLDCHLPPASKVLM